MMIRHLMLLITLIIVRPALLVSQETISKDHSHYTLEQGIELYDHEEYGLAAQVLNKLVNRPLYHTDKNYRKAEILLAQAKLKMRLSNADDHLAQVLKKYEPSSEVSNGYFDLGQYYFSNKEYQKSITYFSKVKDEAYADEMNYKMGYASFVKKDFKTAKRYFTSSLNDQGKYFYPTNYYHGMCSYFENDYSSALKSFRRVEKAGEYKAYVPYYISQIHFAKKEYDQLISYAEPKSKSTNLKNLNRIRLLLGQSYFNKGNYNKALEHLEYYESTTDKLSKEEFYQLAYTQYQNQRWQKAADNFKELVQLKSQMGQVSNYYLADCYLNLGDKSSARAAFKNVSEYTYDPSVQEEAKFNFGKLSAEEGYDTEAIKTMSSFQKGSKYYNEAQSILSQLFLRTKDYNQSIKSLEQLSNKSSELKSAYQVVTLAAALQAYEDGDLSSSKKLLGKSLKSPVNPNFKSQSLFWQALIDQEEGEIDKSIKGFEKYFKSNPSSSLLPKDSKPGMAHYYQGYNYLRKDDYKKSLKQFESSMDSGLTGQHLTDATVRRGDCLFSLNKYKKAKLYYERVQDKEPRTGAYAYYQNAIIEGLEGNTYEKIIQLDELLKKYPKSEYADDALLELGDSYTILGNNSEAFEAYERLILNFQDKSVLINQALLKLGLSSFNQGDVQSSLKYYKKVMANNPTPKESSEALASIEEIYINNMGESKEYLDYLDNLPNHDLTDASRDSLNYKIAELQFENGQYSMASKSFTDYISTHPKGKYIIPAFFNRGESKTFLKDFKGALPDYENVINRGISKYYETSLRKAGIICLNELQDYKKAYDYSISLLNFSSDSQIRHSASLNAMQSAYKSDQLENANNLAQTMIGNTLSTQEDKVAASFVIGKYALVKNEQNQVITSFNYVIRNSNGALAAESSFLLSQLFFDNGDLDKAEEQCKSTNSTSSNYPYWIAKSLLLLSEIYLTNNDLFNARAATEAVIENFSDDKEILAEANQKLEQIKIRENAENRILKEDANGLLNLDNGN